MNAVWHALNEHTTHVTLVLQMVGQMNACNVAKTG